jgi:hypothetical protein
VNVNANVNGNGNRNGNGDDEIVTYDPARPATVTRP